MRILTLIMMLIAVGALILSIAEFLRIKKQLKGTLYCSNLKIIMISNAYIVLLGFFLVAYVLFTIKWVSIPRMDMMAVMLLLLLFFGSLFVALSTLFLRYFVNSVFSIKMNQTDAMTGLMTKSGIEIAATEILEEEGQQAVMVIVDLDNFKQINDVYGHVAGDEIISLIADLIRDTVRGDDLVGRFGGDEYIIILRHIRIGPARDIMKRIDLVVRQELAALNYPECTGISYGLAELDGGCGQSYKDVFCIADAALYEAKKEKKSSQK